MANVRRMLLNQESSKKQPPEQLLFVFLISNLTRYELLGQLLIIGES